MVGRILMTPKRNCYIILRLEKLTEKIALYVAKKSPSFKSISPAFWQSVCVPAVGRRATANFLMYALKHTKFVRSRFVVVKGRERRERAREGGNNRIRFSLPSPFCFSSLLNSESNPR